MKNNPPPNLWSGQLLHFSALAALLLLTGFFWIKIGRPFPILFWLAMAVPIVHQVFVWISWRLELKSKTVSKSIGFSTYLVVFFLLLAARPVVLILLAWVDGNSLGFALVPRTILCLLLLAPAMYTMYSVKKYFGFNRAAGADHFDSKYQNMSVVKKGMFKYSSNGMYVFGFLMFWGIAIAFDSKAALLAAVFSHAYIWIHYYATEKPDMDYIYAHN